MKSKIYILILFLIIPIFSEAQLQKVTLNGYVKELFMFYNPEKQIPGIDAKYLSTNIIHNRLNFRWYASNELTIGIEARNRVFFGQMIRELPIYKTTIDVDRGYFDLSKVIASGKSWFLHSIIDRAWMNYSKGDWSITAGRQRINWGVNLVWNPNDIFNTFSYFDFDYEERPGTDALKIQYYTGVTSSAELVYKIGRDANETAIAGMYRFSKFNYDFQFLGGWAGKDYVIGGGWAGDIKGGGFRGEASWFIPRESDNGSDTAFVASISGDYTLKNSLYLHAGILFNSNGTTGKAGGREIFDMNLTAKMLSFGKYNIFGQASYPITPLFSASISGMLNPCDKSTYIGPSLSYSLGNNLEFMINSQLFFGKEDTEYGDYGYLLFARLKWAF